MDAFNYSKAFSGDMGRPPHEHVGGSSSHCRSCMRGGRLAVFSVGSTSHRDSAKCISRGRAGNALSLPGIDLKSPGLAQQTHRNRVLNIMNRARIGWPKQCVVRTDTTNKEVK